MKWWAVIVNWWQLVYIFVWNSAWRWLNSSSYSFKLKIVTRMILRLRKYFSVALDKSTDISSSAQVLLFIRGVNENFEISEELNAMHLMETVVTVPFLTRDSIWKNWGMWQQMVEHNMCGKKKGLGWIRETMKVIRAEEPVFFLHCIINQEALRAKCLAIDNVMKLVVKTINFIRSHSVKHPAI